MSDLKTYDPDRRCPKCGGHANVKHERVMGIDMLRLIRRCGRCDFFWRDLPLDISESAARIIADYESEEAAL